MGTTYGKPMGGVTVPLIEDGSERFHETAKALAEARACSLEEAEHIVRTFMTTKALETKWETVTVPIPQGVPNPVIELRVGPDGKLVGASVSERD